MIKKARYLVAIAVAIIWCSLIFVKPLQCIWRLGARRRNLPVPPIFKWIAVTWLTDKVLEY